jgi:heptosyltransferase III
MSEGRRETDLKGETLVIHQGALGDLILAVSALNRVFSKGGIDIFCRERFMHLVCHLGTARRAFNVESREFAGLYAEKPDEKFRSWFAPYRQIVLLSNSSVLIKNIESLSGCPVVALPPRPEPEIGIHVADHLSAQLAAAFPGAQRDCLDQTREAQKCKNRPCKQILIHPGSGSPRKNWPLENYVRVYNKLREKRIEVEWIIGPAEKFLEKDLTSRGIAKKEIRADDNLMDFCCRLTPSTGFIGNDSGLTHLTAYLGSPVIVVFGPSDPVRWRPVGPDVTVVGPQTDCPPCFEIQPANCGDAACLESISVERILECII